MNPVAALVRLILLPIFILLLLKLNFIKTIILLICKLFFKREDPIVVRTPDERFKGIEALGYDFPPNYVDLPIGSGKTLPRLHYVDKGPRDAKETILCLHGEPSWSFLYRKMIPGFVKEGYRVIAPDFIGFGKSDKYTHPETYTHDLHTMTIRLLLEYLKVSNITLVCQDWGGLTGLSVVKDCPHLFSRLVIMNTGLPIGKQNKPWHLYKISPFLAWRTFAQLLATALPIQMIFRFALENPSSKVLQAYVAPFPTMSHTAGAARWPLLVPVSSGSLNAGDMRQTRAFLKNDWRNPALVMFSDNDSITETEVQTFKELLPHTKQITVRGGGHFLQEEKGEELATNIIQFIKTSN